MTPKRPKLCVLTPHPVQYMAPWYRALSEERDLELEVIFFRELNALEQGIGFGKKIQWDVPLREGYSNRVLGLSTGLRALVNILPRLYSAIKESRPDVVMITGWNEPGMIAIYPFLRLLGIPILLRGESNSLRVRVWYKRLLHKILLYFISGIIVIGKANREFYLDYGVSQGKLFDGTYFVESERIHDMHEEFRSQRSNLRVNYGFNDEDFVFTFVGKHVLFKRPLLLLEATRIIRQRGWPVKLLFAGEGELTDILKYRAAELDVPAYFTGFLNQTELWKAYVPADAFVLPSTNRETWGLVTNEAMLFRLPVILSDQVGCSPDLVKEGETGYTFSGGAEELAGAMEKLLKNQDRLTSMGIAAQRLILEDYSMTMTTLGLKNALRDLTY